MSGCHIATVTRCDSMADFVACLCCDYSTAGESFGACPCSGYSSAAGKPFRRLLVPRVDYLTSTTIALPKQATGFGLKKNKCTHCPYIKYKKAMNTCLKWKQTTLTILLCQMPGSDIINLWKEVSANGAYSLRDWKDRTTCVPLLSLSGCIPLSVFSVGWWIDGGGRELSCLQPPSAPEWIKDLILALIDRFGDRENELSWHLEISLFLKAQSRFTN